MKTKPKLVILNGTCLDVLDEHQAWLDAQEWEWVADDAFRTLRSDQVDAALQGANALILPAAIRNLPLVEHMERHTSLRVLSIAASGYDWLDIAAATRCGIVVTYAPVPEGSEVVADMAWGLMLAAARQIPHHHRQICRGCYDRGMGVSISRKTLGIIGLGNIGRQVARRAAGFDMRVLAVEPNPNREFVAEQGIELVGLDELLRQSDFVSLHVRLDSATNGMIGARELGLMKPTAFLINTARFELIDHEALTAAILNHRIAGAGLDDPPSRPDSPLLDLPNVVFTPHLGNRGIEGMRAVFRSALEGSLAVLTGKRPEYVVNPEVYDKPLRTGIGT
jgi:D-3-phosphoglycerate dehydrogenase